MLLTIAEAKVEELKQQLAIANARGTCGECYYNRKCSIQDAAQAGDAFYCAAFERKDET